MDGEVLVSLLVTGIFRDVVQILSSDNDGSVHLGGDNGASQDTATDRHQTREGALFVCKIESAKLIQMPARKSRL